MVSFVDKIVGIYHFMSDRVPNNIPLVEPKPRKVNPWCKDGLPLVSKVRVGKDLRASIDEAIALLGNLSQAIKRGDSVFVKPNFNSPDPFPGSTDLEFLRVIIELLHEAGTRVKIGDSSGGMWRPSRKVFRKLGIIEFARKMDIELIAFEDRPNDWLKIKVNGDYLNAVTMPRSAYEADKIVYLPCMKTHRYARYSGALKLAFGFVHPGERRAYHFSQLEQKIAEVSLCWQPDLIVMDGIKAFVSGGPDKGELVEPNIIMASGDLVAIDIEAMKILLKHKAKNRLIKDPRKSQQIATALKHGLGSRGGSYVVID